MVKALFLRRLAVVLKELHPNEIGKAGLAFMSKRVYLSQNDCTMTHQEDTPVSMKIQGSNATVKALHYTSVPCVPVMPVLPLHSLCCVRMRRLRGLDAASG